MSEHTLMRAAVVGLGNAGSRFDERPNLPVFSHVGGYLSLPDEFQVVGGADPSDEARARFAQRCPKAGVFVDAVEMMAATRPDVVSICTPPQGRAALVERLLAVHAPRVIICEKPLETDAANRAALVAACQRHRVQLAVNYTRRYEVVYRAASNAIAEGRIGEPVTLTVRAANRLWSIGSHAVDIALYLAGRPPSSWQILPRPSLVEAGEVAADFLLGFENGVAAHIVTVGMRGVYLFEVDVIGTRGRLAITGNGAKATIAPFIPSTTIAASVVEDTPVLLAERPAGFSPFIEMARELGRLARNEAGARPSATGSDAIAAEKLLDAADAICKSEGPSRGPVT